MEMSCHLKLEAYLYCTPLDTEHFGIPEDKIAYSYHSLAYYNYYNNCVKLDYAEVDYCYGHCYYMLVHWAFVDLAWDHSSTQVMAAVSAAVAAGVSTHHLCWETFQNSKHY